MSCFAARTVSYVVQTAYYIDNTSSTQSAALDTPCDLSARGSCQQSIITQLERHDAAKVKRNSWGAKSLNSHVHAKYRIRGPLDALTSSHRSAGVDKDGRGAAVSSRRLNAYFRYRWLANATPYRYEHGGGRSGKRARPPGENAPEIDISVRLSSGQQRWGGAVYRRRGHGLRRVHAGCEAGTSKRFVWLFLAVQGNWTGKRWLITGLNCWRRRCHVFSLFLSQEFSLSKNETFVISTTDRRQIDEELYSKTSVYFQYKLQYVIIRTEICCKYGFYRNCIVLM